jgi:triacylglycerol lipase
MVGVLGAGRRWSAVGCLVLLAFVAGCTATTALPEPAVSTSAAEASGSPSASDESPPVPSITTASITRASVITASTTAGTAGAPSTTALSSPPASTTPASTTPAPTTSASTTPASTNAALSTPEASTTASSSAPAAVPLPAVDLAGVNVVGCHSSHRPVVLLHGSFSTVGSNFAALVPVLRAAGRCVYGLNYGNGGIAAVASSAGQAAALVTAVLTDTGVGAVDVIAYSQGGLILRTALRLNALATRVATAVLIAPSWNGTTSRAAAAAPASLCPACADQVAGSRLLRELAAGGDLDGKVRYAEISTRADVVVTPVSSQVPVGPPDRVRSAVIEDLCPAVVTDHVQLPAVRGVIDWAVAALDTDGRPPDSTSNC